MIEKTNQAFIEITERETTERILDRMTDPVQIKKRQMRKQEEKRINNVKERLGLWV